MKVVGAVVMLVLVAAGLAGCGRGGAGGHEPAPSAGCGSSAIGTGVTRVEVRSGGDDRWYLRDVPAAHDGERPVPVVVVLHGYGEGAEAHAEVTQLGRYGAVAGFVTLTPHGQGTIPAWDSTADSPDVAFVEDVLDQVEQSLCVDTNRLYVVGSSNGAMLASRLACEASDRIAAVGAVAGIEAVDGCRPERAVPIVAFHGTRDSKIHYGGGLDPGVASLPLAGGSHTIGDIRSRVDFSIPAVMAWWARHESCGSSPERRTVAADTVLLRYPCPGWTAVELYRIDGGGHTWPGRDVGDTPGERQPGPESPLAANDLLWRFLEDHSLSITPSLETLVPDR